MAKIKIIVPSHKRSKILTTKIKGMTLLVHESEAKDYSHLPYSIETHKLNRLTDIRQYAYEKWSDVFMVDDDIEKVEQIYTEKKQTLTPEEVYELIQDTHALATDVGAFLFGFSNASSPKHYKAQKPFVANGYINACAFGLRKSPHLYFNPETTACESHWINLLNAYHHRYSLQDTRFVFKQKANSTFLLEGGQTLKRTIETEKRDSLLLRQTFGESIQLKKGQKDGKLHHPYQRKLNIRL